MMGGRRGSTTMRTEQGVVVGSCVIWFNMMIILLQEEAELRSDGTQNTIKPSQVSVARVSCIRGLVLFVL